MTARKRYVYILRTSEYSDHRIFYITTKAKYAICEHLKNGAKEVEVLRADIEDYRANPMCEMEHVTTCTKQWWDDYLQGKRGW